MSQNKIHPEDELIDMSLGSLPTLIVPDDPVNGVIEKPKSPPPSARPVPRPEPVAVPVEQSTPKVVVVSPRASPPPTQLSELPSATAKPVTESPTASPPATDTTIPAASSSAPAATSTTDPSVSSQSAPPTSARADPTCATPTTSSIPATDPAVSSPVVPPTSAQATPTSANPATEPASAAPSSTPATTDPVVPPSTTTITTDSVVSPPTEPVPPTTVSLPADTPTIPIPSDPPVIVSPNPQPAPTTARSPPNTIVPITQQSTTTLALHSKDVKGLSKRAVALAKLDRLAGGHKSVLDADMSDIGALGIGMQLYFMLTKYLSITFLIMGIISIPAIILHLYGNGVSDNAANPGGFAYTMLGNEGVHPDFGNTSVCYPNKAGYMDCTWNTIETPFTTDPITASWIITTTDIVYSIVFLFFFLYYRYQAKKAIEIHMNENLTPAKYAVYVRGLPSDATEREILEHFNHLYDLSKPEEYHPLWLLCCWGKRRKVKHSLSRHAINRSVVSNIDHLAGTTSITKELYLGTWIAEVSIGHPTGGLLKTFLSMETLTQKIAETNALITILQQEQAYSSTLDMTVKSNRKWKITKKDNQILQKAQLKLQKLEKELDKKTSKIKILKESTTTTKKTSKTQHAFNWEACECAFIVFNNLESRRRCLQDYRKCTSYIPHYFQPKPLRFRQLYPLRVSPAPEPSNILWENLEITDRGRFYRRSFTNLITFLLLLVSCMIISAAQSAQKVMKEKMVPKDFCTSTLPMVYYGNDSFDHLVVNRIPKRYEWELIWENTTICTPGVQNEPRYAIGYSNKVVLPLNTTMSLPLPSTWRPKLGPNAPERSQSPNRCIDPCISEISNRTCSTVGCWDAHVNEEVEACTDYLETNILYCFCSSKVSESVQNYGILEGPQRLWNDYIPCQGFIKGFLTQTITIYSAAAVVVVVNILLKSVLRAFATFEAHSSESAKATTIAAKMFCTQFLNTAVIVLIVNAYLGLDEIPILSDLFKGDRHDFDREWYPTVGIGITMTMVVNAFLPQVLLFIQMYLVAPLTKFIKRRSIRTQSQMNKLYAGPTFDISVRYPMILNSLFVTMAFSGGAPILLFVAAFTAAGTYWFDKLSILHLYSIKTTYDEELGELALSMVPWTLVLHLAFSMWMYGNTEVMKTHTIDIKTLVDVFHINTTTTSSSSSSNTTSTMYDAVMTKASRIDKLGLVPKVIHQNVMIVFILLIVLIVCLLLSKVVSQIVWPVLKKTIGVVLHSLWIHIRGSKEQRRESMMKKKQMTAKVHAEITTNVVPVGVPLVPVEVKTPTPQPEVVRAPTPQSEQVKVSTPQPDVAKVPTPRPEGAKIPTPRPDETKEQPNGSKIPTPRPDTTTKVPTPRPEEAKTPTFNRQEAKVPTPRPDETKVPTPRPDTTKIPTPRTTTTPAPITVPSPPSPPIDHSGLIIPEYTEFFRKSISKSFQPDKQLGFEKNKEGELVRKWREETVRYGIKREAGELMRTWEAMQAPVKSYAIEMNDKYKLAVAEIVAAAKRMKAAKLQLEAEAAATGPLEKVPDAMVQAVEAALVATEPVAIVVVPTTTETSTGASVVAGTQPSPRVATVTGIPTPSPP